MNYKNRDLNKQRKLNITIEESEEYRNAFHYHCKIILLYGDNGTGKSSISDAVEWFFTDKVPHLSGSEIDKALQKFISENPIYQLLPFRLIEI